MLGFSAQFLGDAFKEALDAAEAILDNNEAGKAGVEGKGS